MSGLKGQIAEALVESILRRAKYRVTRFGRESDLRGMLSVGRDEDFAPDFLALKKGLVGAESPGVYPTFMIEVKYRSDLSRFLERQSREGKNSLLAKCKAKWPNLYVIFVTDHPEKGQPCIQALDLKSYEPGAPVRTEALHKIKQLQIYESNVADHEDLTLKIFGLISGLGK